MLELNNIKAKINSHRGQIEQAMARVLNSGWMILGSEVKGFESKFADFLNIPYCVGVGNGTDALEFALRSLNIARGDTVATVANAGMYTTNALMTIGAHPYFMDVDLNTQCVAFLEVQRAVDAGVKALVVTHLYGLATPEIGLIAEFCHSKGVFLVEDCAQAHGARIAGQFVGTFGDISTFSFYPTKNLGALGDGGAVVTHRKELADQVRALRTYGWSDKYKAVINHARNSRLDELQAAVLSDLLEYLEAMNVRRRKIADRYNQNIFHPDIEVPNFSGENYVAHLYVIRTQKREKLIKHLKKHAIASEVHYPIPDYRQPIFKEKWIKTYLPVTEKLSQEILTIPCYPELEDEDVDYVINTLNSW